MPNSKPTSKNSRVLNQQEAKSDSRSSAAKPTKASHVIASRAPHNDGRTAASAFSNKSTGTCCHKPTRTPTKIAVPARDASRSPPPLDPDQDTSASEAEIDEESRSLSYPDLDLASRDGEDAPWSQQLPSPENYAAPNPAVREDSPQVIVREELMEFEHNSAMEANWSINQWLGNDESKREEHIRMRGTDLPVGFYVRHML